MTDDTQAHPDGLPPDPVQYDSPRARIARAKGLEAPYIPGGSEPVPSPSMRNAAPASPAAQVIERVPSQIA